MNGVLGLLAAIAMFLGAAVQGAVGFGASLVAAPLLLLIDPSFVPVPLNISSLVFNVLVVRRERGPHHWRLMRWPIVAAVPGSVAGALVVRTFSTDGLAIFSGLLILLGVAVTASGVHVRRTRANLAAAGGLGGFANTTVGIGGPPLALLFANSSGPEIRGALSRYFLASNVTAIVLLALFGQVHAADLGMALYLIPGGVVGYVTSGWLTRHVDRRHVRMAVLALSTASALLAIGRAAWP
jgi:uncharacterized membrane protein YfcA